MALHKFDPRGAELRVGATMTAYYNEIDPYAAQWLRNLIAAGHIAPGDVDERSIEDVRPDDLRGYTQCHFFAGIGVWSAALRGAGWPDDREVWTGSCPCQPFSAAGKGDGFADERHLWPAWHHLIAQCRPPNVFGEQVASKDGLGWLDLVQTDMEGTGYAFWPVDLCAAGVGAPHIRQRLWFVGEELEHTSIIGRQQRRPQSSGRGFTGGCGFDILAHAERQQREERLSGRGQSDSPQGSGAAIESAGLCLPVGLGDTTDQPRERYAGSLFGTQTAVDGAGLTIDGRVSFGAKHAGSGMGGMVNTDGPRSEAGIPAQGHREEGYAGEPDNSSGEFGRASRSPAIPRPGPTNGHWRDPDWLFCRDGKWRPVEPGTFPLAHGAPARVGRLRAYGNAIVKEAAEAVICSYIDHETSRLDIENCEFI